MINAQRDIIVYIMNSSKKSGQKHLVEDSNELWEQLTLQIDSDPTELQLIETS